MAAGGGGLRGLTFELADFETDAHLRPEIVHADKWSVSAD
jgi:hypothetical protein